MTVPVDLAERLAGVVGTRSVLRKPSELVVYRSDGLPGYSKKPRLAVFPRTRDELIAVVRLLADARVPFVPRGAGTGLSGGALADDVVLIGLNRLNRILSIDPVERLAVVEPGVVNVALTRAATPYALHYAPDPFEPGRMHDRRQRGRERGRPTLPEIRRDAQSRPRA